MKSVKDRIQNWEAKSIEQSSINQSDFQNGINNIRSSNGQPNIVIANRMTQMSDARSILEMMQSKTENKNLIPGALPPRHSVRTSEQIAQQYSSSYNQQSRQNPINYNNTDNYERQFLNIRGTLNLKQKKQPSVPRNTVNVNYADQILKPSMVRQLSAAKNNKVQDQLPQRLTQQPNIQNNLMKTMIVQVDKGVHYRTQKLINAMFGQQTQDQKDEFGYSKSKEGMIRLTNQHNPNLNIPKFRSQAPLLMRTQGQPQSRGRSKNKRHLQNFDDL